MFGILDIIVYSLEFLNKSCIRTFIKKIFGIYNILIFDSCFGLCMVLIPLVSFKKIFNADCSGTGFI